MEKISYYWYHHCSLSRSEKEQIREVILSHDFEAFQKIAAKWNAVSEEKGWEPYFPATGFLPESRKSISIMNPENFNRIDYEESECG